ncbi:other 1 protein kinase [Moniliophthora roreri MCA 2997]|nr:other 1 protein kinase [Moniliophthora roreri MCA 2997]
MLATQFRTHVFCVEVVGDHARLIRFDREGAVATSAFRYAERTHLVDFLWRFNHSSPETRGHDPTVSIPSAAESSFVNRAKEILLLKPWEKVRKFSVYDEESKKTVVFYGGAKPSSASVHPFGRSTRGFLVIDVEGNIVYLKDTWRIDAEGMSREGDIYAQLHRKNVPHILHVVAHGDVPQQKTVAKSYFPYLFEDEEPSPPYQHYYIAFREVGRPLTNFVTTYELVNAVKDAIKAHQVAYDEARILHRDISAGNILISADGKSGFLIDWEFSTPVRDRETPLEHERTGTWQFMSANLLLGKGPYCHTRIDDLESFFHVICWMVLRYGPHKLSPQLVNQRLGVAYDSAWACQEKTYGGDFKEWCFKARGLRHQTMVSSGCLNDLLVDFEDFVAVRYEYPSSNADRLEHDSITAGADDDEAGSYDHNMARLEDWNWIYERFCKATEDPTQLADVRVDRTKAVEHPSPRHLPVCKKRPTSSSFSQPTPRRIRTY